MHAQSVRVLSGIRATGELHLGNYLGALVQWKETAREADSYFFIADLHGLTEATATHNAKDFADQRLRTAASFLAAGIDPKVSTLFFQSAIAEHTYLMWLISSVARKGELDRMTQWKDKGVGRAGASAGLFTYPVLMAADILLYDATHVPVGEDQRQHVEVTRDWANRFNHYFGDVFVTPEATTPAEGARVMDLSEPTRKMSKSEESLSGVVGVGDSPDEIMAKFKRAVTDNDKQVVFDRQAKPGISNLIEILASVTSRDRSDIEREYEGVSYGDFKEAVGAAVVEALRPIREGMDELLSDREELARLCDVGAERARAVAQATCARAREALGVGAL